MLKNIVNFQQYQGRMFNARRMFRFGILCVQSMVRIKRLKFTPEPLSILVARRDPYRMKAVRKVNSFFFLCTALQSFKSISNVIVFFS